MHSYRIEAWQSQEKYQSTWEKKLNRDLIQANIEVVAKLTFVLISFDLTLIHLLFLNKESFKSTSSVLHLVRKRTIGSILAPSYRADHSHQSTVILTIILGYRLILSLFQAPGSLGRAKKRKKKRASEEKTRVSPRFFLARPQPQLPRAWNRLLDT